MELIIVVLILQNEFGDNLRLKSMRIIMMFLFIAASTLSLAQNSTILKDVSAEEFKSLIDSKDGIVLDIRTPMEVNRGAIANASTADFYNSGFKQRLSLMQKDKPIFMYCHSGSRTGAAKQTMKDLGFKEVYILSGGINSWRAKGYPLVKPEGGSQESLPGITIADFDKILSDAGSKPVLADFHSQWCIPCRKMAPVIDEISKEYAGKIEVRTIDVDQSSDLVKKYSISGIPVFLLFDKKTEKWRHAGIISKADLKKQIDSML